MSHRHDHPEQDHQEHPHDEHPHDRHGHGHRGHRHHGHAHGAGRLRHVLRRRLRRHGDDVQALEELQRDLEQAAADVAARVSRLRAPAGD
jgi:hypothetical protein